MRTLAIGVACALPRLVFLIVYGPAPADGFNWDLSTGLRERFAFANGGGATAEFDPLYPAFLAVARVLTRDSPWGVAGVQILVASAGAVLLDRLVRAMTGRAAAGAIAAALYAGYPYLIRQSVSWLEVTFVSTLLLAAWLSWAERRWVRCAGWLGLVTLARFMMLPIGLLAIAAIVTWAPRRQALGALLVFACLVGPWMARTYRMDGTLLPSRNGEDLYVGNNPYGFAMIPRDDLDLLVEPAHRAIELDAGRRLSPAELNREYTTRAVAFMTSNGWRTLGAKIANVYYLFQPRLVPYQPAGPETAITFLPDGRYRVERPRQRSAPQELAHAIAYGGVLAAGLVGLFRRRRLWREDALILLSILVVTAVASVYFPTTRIRAPLDPALMAYAACAISRRLDHPLE